ncbi:MAG: uroporphyrinogen-III C-methyltransferase, partial [Planctomycetes bacterium]|nr:uroporphyrinogen-III C-methyltransferase [Planctomycetota bacterium]
MTRMGKVYLVGAGPGDPGLISLKGLQCLRRADLVLYDGLVNPLLLRHTPATAERTSRKASPLGPAMSQQEINERLIEAARQGKTVVRLKGGDPYIFGRGSEEALALAEAGVPFEVVPGITAATAAGAYVGFSLTHRDCASAVAFITGHEHPAPDKERIDYDVLAAFPGTLVFYMGLHRIGEIVQALLDGGKEPETPAAVVSQATLPQQRILVAPLHELPHAVAQAGALPPSLIVIGECVRMREKLQWFEHLPLFGKRIGITRPLTQADATIERVVELGGQPVLLPTIEIRPPEDWAPVDRVLQRLGEYDWIVFTSANGVEGLFGRLWQTGGDLRQVGRVQLAAIGPATADALERFHLRADLVPDAYRAEELAAVLKAHVPGRRVLWARSTRARDVLPRELEAAGAHLDQCIVYQNVDREQLTPEELAMIEQGELDWIGLSSPSIARSLFRLLTPRALAQLGERVRIASISPVTTEAALEVGLPVNAEAIEYTWDG